MLHLLTGDRPWFRPRSRGYGTGLPIAWQGWLVIALHIALITGIAALLQGRPLPLTLAVIAAGLAPLPIYRARTEGGWKWR
ncbi:MULTISPECIES: hypothetical protein [unclassified Sphingopyxis]|uniref:hypothetical protein n=1 Tax=unclassified Sphingopyxis TaxID=2614943 RepID=UPI000735F6F3|nr:MULTISPECIES: hypothetical protein [unclassified Sphingopyxis]KTE23542.1 hypothetical protein ATE62_22605 [Sphingopyxis sp. HIX]KTE80702.1 hypothetical protein ATE72_17780 [Sphingopyxis sp. HXXIV]